MFKRSKFVNNIHNCCYIGYNALVQYVVRANVCISILKATEYSDS